MTVPSTASTLHQSITPPPRIKGSNAPLAVQAAAMRPRTTLAEAGKIAGISARGMESRLRREKQRQRTQVPVPHTLDAIQRDWGTSTLMALTRMQEALAVGDVRAAQSAAIAAGIGTDKSLVMAGRPTALVMQVHAHRLELGRIAESLAGARAALLPVTQRDSA